MVTQAEQVAAARARRDAAQARLKSLVDRQRVIRDQLAKQGITSKNQLFRNEEFKDLDRVIRIQTSRVRNAREDVRKARGDTGRQLVRVSATAQTKGFSAKRGQVKKSSNRQRETQTTRVREGQTFTPAKQKQDVSKVIKTKPKQVPNQFTRVQPPKKVSASLQRKRILSSATPVSQKITTVKQSPQQANNLFSAVRKETRQDQFQVARSLFSGELDSTLAAAKGIKTREVPQNIALGGFNALSSITKLLINPKGKDKVNVFTDNIASVTIGAAFKYGRNLVRRKEAGAKSPFVSDVARIARGTRDVGSFVVNNPAKAAIIVGASGLGVGTAGQKAFQKNPVAATTEAMILLLPNTVLRGAKFLNDATAKPVVARAFSKSKDPIRKANGDMIVNVPKFDVELSKSGLEKEMRRRANEAEKQLNRVKQKQNSGKKLNAKDKSDRNKYEKSARSIRKSALALKLKPETISKGLGNLFKTPLPTLKVVRVLPRDTKQLQGLLGDARKVSGNEFAKLKNRIKKDFGLNVVVRNAQSKNPTFALLEPKENRRLGVTTSRTKVNVITSDGRILDISKRKGQAELPKSQQLTSKDRKDIEFKEGQNYDKLANDFRRIGKKQGLLGDKKAQSQMGQTVRRGFAKAKQNATKISKKSRELRQRVTKYNTLAKRKDLTPSQRSRLQKDRASIVKQRKDLDKDVVMVRKELLGLRKANSVLSRLGLASKVSSASITKTASALVPAPIPPVAPVPGPAIPGSGPSIPRRPTPKKGGGRGSPAKPKPKKASKKPRVARRPPVTVPKKVPLPTFRTKLKTGENLAFDFRFRARKNESKNFNKRTNPVVTKQTALADPQNKALRSAIGKIRRTTARSLDLVIVGVTKKKDVNKPDLKGFRLKRTGSRTLRLVQINPIETAAEKRALRRARRT